MIKFFKSMLVVLVAVIFITYTGCSLIPDLYEGERFEKARSVTVDYPEQNFEVESYKDWSRYTFANTLTIDFYCHRGEKVEAKLGDDSELLFIGVIDKFAWKSNVLIVIEDDEYYVFDLDSGENSIDYTKYTKSEFKELHPNYKDEFKWFERPIERDEGYESKWWQ